MRKCVCGHCLLKRRNAARSLVNYILGTISGTSSQAPNSRLGERVVCVYRLSRTGVPSLSLPLPSYLLFPSLSLPHSSLPSCFKARYTFTPSMSHSLITEGNPGLTIQEPSNKLSDSITVKGNLLLRCTVGFVMRGMQTPPRPLNGVLISQDHLP